MLQQASRISSVDLDPSPKSRKRKPARKHKPVTRDSLRQWATGGAYGMLALSGLLNGMANAQHSPYVWAGWAMGLAIPLIVLVGFRVAGMLAQRKLRHLSYAAGIASSGLLVLSIYHCAESVALLTGGSIGLALPMAVAIDTLLVLCEISALYA